MSTCEICNYTTNRNNNYIRHMASKKHLKIAANGKLEGDNIKKFHCSYCDIYFKDKYDAKQHDKTDKHLKQRALRWQEQKPAEATPQEKHKIKKAIENAAWRKTYIHKERKITNRKINEKADKYIFNPEDFEDYNYLDQKQMTKLILSFVKYIKNKKVDIENYINYEYWDNDKDDEDETTNLYIELYELLQDKNQLTEITNL